MPDLTKLVFHSSYPAFKNNNEYSGSFNITGTVVAGVNTRTVIIDLPKAPDIGDIQFQGRGEVGFSTTDFSTNPRPTAGWFREGIIFVRGDGTGYSNYPVPWVINAQISGSQIIITLTCVIQFTATLTLTSETVNYKIVDYINT